ncbi:dUTP diphosphatase [Clostridium omnivorum]|uniref:Deoxyuridine 5'-triphosphate nucleotidohydrolase n=1 Tax=Clostridium omnivorum TaxID=1604902 RepID=A0ABQ5NBY4_9CLOT|nr:dUTP diphosphatase [Clostridium sp. E14]GLC32696.1 deoxyuridine 5'-triphosphate nucleotidohydrolase [Clostridium sp. E14]
MLLRIKKVPEFKDLPTPKFMTEGSVGMDLYAAIEEEIILKPFERKLIPTGILIELPCGYEAQIRPRSGLANKYGVTLVNTPGTIDWDYRGEIKVIMINLGNEDFKINRADRIAQMVFNKVEIPIIEEVEYIESTERGSGGFGSTGK